MADKWDLSNLKRDVSGLQTLPSGGKQETENQSGRGGRVGLKLGVMGAVTDSGFGPRNSARLFHHREVKVAGEIFVFIRSLVMVCLTSLSTCRFLTLFDRSSPSVVFRAEKLSVTSGTRT